MYTLVVESLGESASILAKMEFLQMTELGHNPIELGKVVSRDPEIHSGDLVFSGTRVPVDTLVDYLKADHSIEEFLKDFPSVDRWQIDSYLELSPEGLDRLRAQGASTA